MQSLKSMVAGLAAWMAPGIALAQQAPGYGGGYDGAYRNHPHMWGDWGGMFLGPVFGILFIAAIAVAVVLVVRALGGGTARRGAPSALDILDERFARGEIDRDEYEERKRVLRSG